VNRVARVALLLALGACAGAPAPVPFDGPSPARIALLPLSTAALEPDELRAMDGVAAERVAAAGFAVVPAGVVSNALASLSGLPDSAWPALGAQFDAEAILERTATVVTSIDAGSSLVLEVRWRIVRAESLRAHWDQSVRVRAGEIVAEHLTGPTNRPGRDAFLADEPIHGRAFGDLRTATRAESPLDLIDLAERRLAARLPTAVDSRR